MHNPYRGRDARAFWKSAVAEHHLADMTDVWDPIALNPEDCIATAGSCFAQHIGHALATRGAHFLDCEPPPPVFADAAEARRFGYGVFSCRYGNVYTARQMLQLAQEALGLRRPAEVVWEREGRFYDALRPAVDPAGHATPETVHLARRLHLGAVRTMLETMDVLVFTLGLTECWESLADGTAYPTAPGTIAGSFDPAAHAFRNMRHGEVVADMTAFWALVKEINPGARMLLTVSPVPLMATASGGHVLPATVYSKSVLRAAAGDLAADLPDTTYFPSYEIIAGHPSRGLFFNPDLRTVNPMGVDLVMRHFFSGPLANVFAPPGHTAERAPEAICEEGRITETL
ncbi:MULTISPECIES: GSCFA domain-containing protein [unclassified Novosphingobium]|uniref:GSCFA domain-containing protein n=1 Tax=unclassified Novosphingobium TaxID=2644732 RepID=UPI00146C938B|nr:MULTISPECIES: GSCFA domain-containing protein [unclassified Novosphingobium]NMN07142.1 hypothetical protein [Novosphingobium sp. SG919]NMN89270.1 hypothetical protein [Novosphingobium sp. SG916]